MLRATFALMSSRASFLMPYCDLLFIQDDPFFLFVTFSFEIDKNYISESIDKLGEQVNSRSRRRIRFLNGSPLEWVLGKNCVPSWLRWRKRRSILWRSMPPSQHLWLLRHPKMSNPNWKELLTRNYPYLCCDIRLRFERPAKGEDDKSRCEKAFAA